ncbi:MAG: hypothetical protein NMNS01_25750 [Nitrosomonas sp.]|nr:MAG: hypothetical protein NMNS01_25750 [Nitrosomonas sp.]
MSSIPNKVEDAFKATIPYHEAIDPVELLDETSNTIKRFIVLDEHQSDIAALWVAACWFVDHIYTAPIALINAPDKACGKTQLLTVMRKLSPKADQCAGLSSNALFRIIDKHKPTLFIDEIETVLKDNEALRGVLNAGHTRDSAFVWRSSSSKDDHELLRFSAWGMKAIAGINAISLADTITSRSIIFEMRRKKPSEKVDRLRNAEPELFETLQPKFARFAVDYAKSVQEAKPHMPDSLSDREQDNYEPLLQIAQVAGGHWPAKAYDAAMKICETTESRSSSTTELLRDIREIFDSHEASKISCNDLINMLAKDIEKPWGTYHRGKTLSTRQLSNMLNPYGIQSKTVRVEGQAVRGYDLNQFKDTFERYL